MMETTARRFRMSPTMTTAMVGLCAFAAAVGVGPARGETVSVNCPDSLRETTKPVNVPEDWTGRVRVRALKLEDAEASDNGGKTQITCKYSNGATLRRTLPDDWKDCRMRRRHQQNRVQISFYCQKRLFVTPVPSPGIFSSGSLDLPRTFVMDLDAGTVGGLSRAGDIFYQADSSTLLYLNPQSGARMWLGDGKKRSYQQCNAGRYSSNRISLRDVLASSHTDGRVYVCVKTSAGRVGWFSIPKRASSTQVLKVQYATWKLSSD